VLADLGLIDRRELSTVPSKVVNSLSNPKGRQLFRILNRFFATEPMLSLDPGGGGRRLWTSLKLLGEMWAMGWIDELSRRGLSLTELSGIGELTFHQTGHRTEQLTACNLLTESVARGRRKRYQLSNETRQGMLLIAGIARWRQRHTLSAGARGLSVGEMATVLRSCLPLIALPDHPGMGFKLGVVEAEKGKRELETLMGHVSGNGAISCVQDKPQPDSWAIGTVNAWFAALLEGERGRMRVGGNLDLVDSCLQRLFGLSRLHRRRPAIATLG
jgi:hypothetical protein